MDNIQTIDYHHAHAALKDYLTTLQQQLCTLLTQIDNSAQEFIVDPWQHHSGGGGVTCILENGHVIEKAAVNLAAVRGTALPGSASRAAWPFSVSGFQALGLSVIIHPLNPYIPTTHANLRFIILETEHQPCYWWFGGGMDLTPYYAFSEDCHAWHQAARAACLPFGADIYPRFKQWCDEYFYLPHRQESRGVGGIFFDDLNNVSDARWNWEQSFAFIRAVGTAFSTAYTTIITKRREHIFCELERRFQAYRRGRYVEFNLLHDRGTMFGLQSGGRTQSILASLPPNVSWPFTLEPTLALHEQTLQQFLQPRQWL